MAKKGKSFAEKVAKERGAAKKMAKLVIAEKKPNGHYSFRTRIVPADEAKAEIAKAKA